MILAAIVLGILNFLTGKFLELRIIKKELIQSRDTINMLNYLLTSSNLLVKMDGSRARLMLNESMFKQKDEVINALEGPISFMDYNYELEVFSDAFFSKSEYEKFSTVHFDMNSECYKDIYFSVTRDAGALICKESSNYFCKPILLRFRTVETPISQLAAWISKICNIGYEGYEKHLPLNTTEIKECKGTEENCGIEINTKEKFIRFYFSDGQNSTKNYYCDKELEAIITAGEGCVSLVVNKTSKAPDKIFIYGPLLVMK